MNRKPLVVGMTVAAVVVVLGLAIFLITQPPVAKDETAGAIGAAQRYRAEQIKEGDTGINGTTGPTNPLTTVDVEATLGRGVADQRLEALNHASLEQQSAMWANMSAMERFNAYQRLSPDMQRLVLDRAPEAQRIGFDRFVAERIVAGKASSDALGRVVADQRLEALNHASLEQQSAMLANASAMERLNAYQRLSPGMQRQVLDRAPEAQRIDFERFVAERISQQRVSQDRVTQERVSTQRIDQP